MKGGNFFVAVGFVVGLANVGVYGFIFPGASHVLHSPGAPPFGGASRSVYRTNPAPFGRREISRSRGFNSAQSLHAMLDVGDLFKGADPPPENILQAVESSGRRVTGADIASAAGVSLTDAQKSLSTLAMLTGGALEVSKDGEIVYVFDSSFRNTLRAR
jgi:hypothetical protein